MQMKKTVIVIGAGAAGLMAGISAARCGAKVAILEAQELPGRKLLVTGNGRCNLTNTAKTLPEKYHGTGAALARKLTGEFGSDETLRFFGELGLLTQSKDGLIYPYSSQASSVLDVLLAEFRRWNGKLKFSQKIERIIDHQSEKNDANHAAAANSTRFSVITPTWTYTADAVILACGSKASPQAGANDSGYSLAKSLGHTIIPLRPALVPFVCSGYFTEQEFAGVRCHAKVTLLHSESGLWTDTTTKVLASDTGELQWTQYGVSGIVIFQLSRYFMDVSDPKPEKTSRHSKLAETRHIPADPVYYVLRIDFLPDYTRKKLKELLLRRAAELSKEAPSVLLRGVLNGKMIPRMLSRAGQGKVPKTCGELGEAFIDELIQTMKVYKLPVTGTKSFDQAQICAGGVDCRELTGRLESKLHEGLYFAGEMLDVDGPCGGYNLQWAWTSGYLAGKYAAERTSMENEADWRDSNRY